MPDDLYWIEMSLPGRMSSKVMSVVIVDLVWRKAENRLTSLIVELKDSKHYLPSSRCSMK